MSRLSITLESVPEHLVHFIGFPLFLIFAYLGASFKSIPLPIVLMSTIFFYQSYLSFFLRWRRKKAGSSKSSSLVLKLHKSSSSSLAVVFFFVSSDWRAGGVA